MLFHTYPTFQKEVLKFYFTTFIAGYLIRSSFTHRNCWGLPSFFSSSDGCYQAVTSRFIQEIWYRIMELESLSNRVHVHVWRICRVPGSSLKLPSHPFTANDQMYHCYLTVGDKILVRPTKDHMNTIVSWNKIQSKDRIKKIVFSTNSTNCNTES